MTAMVDSKLETVQTHLPYNPGVERFVLVGLAGPAAGVEYVLDKRTTTVGRSTSCDICLTDDQVSRRHVELSIVPDPIESTRPFVMIQDLKSRNGIRVNGWALESTLLEGGEKILVGRSVFRLERRDDFDLAHGARVRELTVTDSLTGLGNRAAFQEAIEQREAARRSQGLPYAVLVIDLDHFKAVNDGFGHAAGDAALRHTAGAIRSALRAGDGAFRFGGEEFVVILPGASAAEGLRVAERIRLKLEQTPVHYAGQSIAFTASIGVAAGAPLAFSAADSALYDAKREGRNRVREARAVVC